MKKSSQRLFLLFAAALVFTVAAIPAFARDSAVKMKDFAKNAHPGAIITFSTEDIEANTLSQSLPTEFLVAGLPQRDIGTLYLGEKQLSEGAVFKADEIAALTFAPGAKTEFSSELSLIPLTDGDQIGRAASPITVTLNYSETPNSPPAAADLCFETCSNMPIYLNLSAYDHDGDSLTYTVVSSGENCRLSTVGSRLVFTPGEDKTGKCRILYYAEDSAGNTSGLSEVNVEIKKSSGEHSYADISDPAAVFYAHSLAEEGIFRGESFGNIEVLSPSKGFSRTEFAALCAAAVNLKTDPRANIETADLVPWQAPYAETAIAAGAFDGGDLTSPVGARSAVYIAVSTLEAALGRELEGDCFSIAKSTGILPQGLADGQLSREAALEIVYRLNQVAQGERMGWMSVR